jgi:L-rhamnose isomerase
MALQHHFVVVVEDGKLWIDDDTTDHKFYEGSVWNTEIEDWEANYEHATENETARELLWDKLNKENA